MTHAHSLRWRVLATLTVVLCVALCGAQAARQGKVSADQAKAELNAKAQLTKGREFLEAGQTERGLKLIADVVRMYPKSAARYQALLTLGRHHIAKGRFDQAIRSFRQVQSSQDDGERAEAIYQTGICHYRLGDYGNAFVSLRKVANDYPWSVHANQAYYYIGLCHYKQGQWSKAIEALELVGTSVPMNVKTTSQAEAGQRLYVKVHDKDLVVLMKDKGQLKLQIKAASGDVETVSLSRLGRTLDHSIGSVRTKPGKPAPEDGVLQIKGLDTVTCTYVDANTLEGEPNRKVVATVNMVSTAVIGFTDGAFQDYVKGAFADSDCFLRVKDLDRNVSDNPDSVAVRVFTRYKQEKKVAAEAASLDESTVLLERDSLNLTLRETEAHSGIFVGKLTPRIVQDAAAVNPKDAELSTMKGDDICLEYVDEQHLLAKEPRKLTAAAKMLIGQMKDVRIEHRVVDTADLRARKDVIEAKIFLKLATVFKDVGLLKQTNEKADEGLRRIDNVLRMRVNLERTIVEEAFRVKWELLLAQDKLEEAVATCRVLMQLFPDSTLVDEALFKIATAKWEAKDYDEAVRIFNGILALPRSEQKAKAQFSIARIYDQMARERATKNPRAKPIRTAALLAYKACADNYPDSPEAGECLVQIVDYYISEGDYPRALDLIAQVFQDHPDAAFLDRMLQKWVVAAYRVGDYVTAKEKAEQLIAEYPNSKVAPKMKEYMKVIDRKLN